MPYTVVTTARTVLTVDADEHRVEGGHHVFRTTRVVMRQSRSVVVRRLPVSEVDRVTPLA